MKTATMLKTVGSLVVAGALALTATPAVAVGPNNYTCTGGDIPSGTYANVSVTGACTVPADAVITINGNVTVAAGASLDAQSAPATITIRGNVTATGAAYLGLGCQPPSLTGNSAHECEINPLGYSTISVGGNVTATNASLVQLNGITVRGNVTLTGGGGGQWQYWSTKNNTISGNVTITGQRADWLGFLFNTVSGNVTINNVVITDSEPGGGVYIVRNTISGNLSCTGNVPGVSGGFIPGDVNIVKGRATGQCAPLTSPNPAPAS